MFVFQHFHFSSAIIFVAPALQLSNLFSLFRVVNMHAATYIPVQTVTAENGISYAYRRLGPLDGVPLVMHMHVSFSTDDHNWPRTAKFSTPEWSLT